MNASIKTTAVFLRPFQLPSFNETLPPGEYEIETQLLEPVDWIEPGTWTSSVLIHLHPRRSHPGLERTLAVPLVDLEQAVVQDNLTGKVLTDYLLEEMLADPMIRLVMQADGRSETEIRDLNAARPDRGSGVPDAMGDAAGSQKEKAVRDPGPRIGSARPGIGE